MSFTVARGTALAGSGTAIGMVIALAAIVVANRSDEPAAYAAPSAVAFLGPMVAASAIAFIGAVKGNRPLLVVAATALTFASLSAFSGVTLILLVPAVLLFYVASRGDGARPEPRSARRWLAVLIAAVVTAPILILLLTRVGVVGFVVGLVLALVVAAVGEGAVTRAGPRPSTGSLALVVATVGLLIGGIIVLYGRTERLCWQRVQTANGPVESIGPGSPSGEVVLSGPGEGGCGSVPTSDGLALGLILLGLSVTGAALAPGTPPTDARASHPADDRSSKAPRTPE